MSSRRSATAARRERSDMSDRKPTQNKSKPKVQKKIRLTIAQLQSLEVNLPSGFKNIGQYLVISIGPGGTTVGIAENQPKLKPLDDFNKLFQARRVVNSVSANSKKTKASIAARVAILRQKKLSQVPVNVVPDNFQSELVKFQQYEKNLEKNLNSINSNANSESESKIVKKFLVSMVARIRATWQSFFELTLKEGKASLNDMLRLNGVSHQIYSKLISPQIQISSAMNLARVLFPVKANNGFKLTVMEWRTDSILQTHAVILSNSEYLIKLLSDNELLKKFGGIIGKFEETNPEYKKVMETPLYVIPYFNWKNYLESVKDMPTPKRIGSQEEILERYALSLFNIYLMNPQIGISLKEFYQTYDKNLVYDKESVLKPREQILKLVKKDDRIADQILSPTDVGAKAKFIKLITWFFRPVEEWNNILTVAINAPAHVFIRNIGKVDNVIPYHLEKISDVENIELTKTTDPIALSVRLPSAKHKKLQSVSALPKKVSAMLEDLDKQFDPIMPDIKAYLRSFFDEDFMVLAARIILAESERDEPIMPEEEDLEGEDPGSESESDRENNPEDNNFGKPTTSAKLKEEE